MAWNNPIYDRTAADIANKTNKAYFNLADWYRIYDNSLIVRNDIQTLYGVSIPFTTMTYPMTDEFITAVQVNTLVKNIELARQACGLPLELGLAVLRYDWAGGASASAPTYLTVNDWERDLYLMYVYPAYANSYRVCCGVAQVGQVRFWQNKFR